MDSAPLENANNSAKKVRRTKKQLNSNTQTNPTTEVNGNSNITNTGSTSNNNTNSNNNNSLGTSSSSQNSQPILHTEMINYVNKLEYLALKTRLQLHRERKAYSQLFSSLGQFFDSKGIAAKQVQDYVDSVVTKLHDDRESVETNPDDLDWLKFIKQAAKDHPKSLNDPNNLTLHNGNSLSNIQQGQLQVPTTTSTTSGQISSNGSNVIRLPISRQIEQQQTDKAKSQISKVNVKRGNKIEPSIDDSDEPKLKRKKRNEPATNTTGNYNTEAIPVYQQPPQQQFTQGNFQQPTQQPSVQQQNYLTQQEMFIQNLLKAQQRNQMAANNLPYDQIMQQMLLAYQQQPQQQQKHSMDFPLED